MTSNSVETHVDLIDFHVGSPALPRRSSISQINYGYDTENLIDTELPVFEQKLQTQSSIVSPQSRKNSVDVEDILINIDSDEFETDSLDGVEVETNDFLNVCEEVSGNNGNTESTLPVDNFEALLVLKNLDDLLNATLEESEDITNGNSNDGEDSQEIDDDTQYIIEECLEDLDNYLQAIETYDTDSNLSDESIERSSPSEDHEEPQEEFDEELARMKLRHIEENYRKFVASGIVNRGYIDTENNSNFMLDDHLRRPSSACAIASQPLNRKQALRANTVNGARKERPRLIRRKSLNEYNIAPQSSTLTRTSGTDVVTTASESGRLSHDVSRERHAHASADRCTGTVIVEPLHRQYKASSSSTSAGLNETAPSEPCGTGRSPWLRNSMRRLQQLTLPNVDSSDVIVNVDDGRNTNRLEVPNETRPVSAPSRLPPLATPSDRLSRSRSRNLVSQQPNGRARSGSTSSHSRGQRSVSSSETSVASSADSTLSRMQPLEGTSNTSNVEDPAVINNQRRYAFLFAGIIYGASKLHILRAIDAGKAEEKARKKVELAAKLQEEKRLAAERDFQQIIEIFSPPPRPPPDIEPPVQTSCDSMTNNAEGLTERCESSYETIYRDSLSPTIESSDQDKHETDLLNKPLDLSENGFKKDSKPDFYGGSEDILQQEKEGPGNVIQEFDDLPFLPPDDRDCRIPPEK